MITISKNLTKGALAIAGTAAALSFAGAAQAAVIAGTGGANGTAILPTSNVNPTIKFDTVPTAVSDPTGQFTGGTYVPQVFKDIALTGSGANAAFTYSTITDFISILRSPAEGGGTVKVDLLAGTINRFQSGVNFAFNGSFLPAVFTEPDGEKVAGFLTINASSNTAPSGTSQTYQITFNKTGEPVAVTPEPSAILGLLGVAGIGALARRRKS